MKLREIDRWITQFTDGFTSAQSKVEQVVNLDQALGNKLDRIGEQIEKLANFSARTEQKIQSAGTKLEALAEIPARAGQKIDRLVNAPPTDKSGGA